MRRGAILLWGVAAAVVCAPEAALAQERSFDIPSQPANRAIVEFARQAGIQIVAPGSKLRGLRTRAIKGRMDIRAALRAMLDGTGVQIVADSNNTITLGLVEQPSRFAARPKAATGGAANDGQAGPQSTPGRSSTARPTPTKAPPPPAIAPALVDAVPILVTGSRIRREALDSPVPVTAINADLIKDLGHNNAQDVVRLIPQNIASQSDATSGTRLSADIGASYANLRGLNPTFGTRTLTLVNSRRFVPTSDGGQVDLNLIPSVLFGRIETVTGGASAAYGSDAVAGVVNILLDDKLDGFKGVIDYGQTERADGKGLRAAAAFGVKFAGGRGHFKIGSEFQKHDGIGQCLELRDWCAEGWGVVANEASIQPGQPNAPGNISGYDVPGSFGYGQPNFVLGRDVALVYNSPYGVIRNLYRAGGSSTTAFSANFPAIAPPFAAIDKVFTPDGAGVIGYDPGHYGPKTVGGLALGGDNASAYGDQRIQTPLERHTTYAAGELAFSDALKLFAELTYAQRHSQSQSLTAATRSTMPIKPDNAYLPPAVAALLDGANFSLGKDVDGELDNTITVDAKVFRGLVGLSGKLFSDWTWDTYYQYGQNRRNSSIRYSRYNDAFTMAIDAIRDPGDPARIICRPLSPTLLTTFSAAYQAELNALYAQCQPLNLFGQGHMTRAAIDFAWRPLVEDFRYRQHVLAGSVQGTLSGGWGAGPIGVAGGIDFRDEAGKVTHGGINPNAYAFSFGLDYAGKIQVLEGFVEANVPVFRNSAIGDLLELNGAVRYTSNRSTDTLTGQSRRINATSWKAGAIFDITGGLRLRATQSRDIRAAGFRELFQKTAPTDEGTAQGRVNNPNITGPNKVDAVPIFSGGNFGLTPERANTSTIGAVITPGFLPGLTLSLDWYQIRLRDTIAGLNGQRVTDLCVLYQVLCERITFASPTDITRIDAGQANVGRMDIRGYDFEASWRKPLAEISGSLRGKLGLRFLLNHQYDLVINPGAGATVIDFAGQSGPVLDGGDFNPAPKWLWNALISYDTDRFNATVTLRHVGKGVLNMEWIGPEDPGYASTRENSVTTNRVSGATYVNLAMSYEVPLGKGSEPHVELFATIDNLFDRKPPIAPGGGVPGGTVYPTNPVYFDTFGTRWKAGMRLTF